MEERKTGGLTTAATWLALVTALVTSGYSFGLQASRIGTLEKQVEDMRADTRSTAATLGQINERTARMDAKLEILLPTASLRARER
jgi:hypothetical protein